MKYEIFVFFVLFLVIGCTSSKYGYSLEEWNGMTQQERDEIRLQAENMVEKARAQQREKEFVDQSVNSLFGTRSNTY